MSAPMHPGFDDESGPGLPPQLRDPLGVLRRGWVWGAVAFVLLAIPAVVGSYMVPLQYEAASRLMLRSKAIPDEYVPDTIVSGGSEQFQAVQNRVLSRERLSELVLELEPVETEPGVKKKTLLDRVADLRDALQIDKRTIRDELGRERSMEIRVAMSGTQPEHLANVVNRITNELIDEYLLYRSEQSQVTLTFMEREFEEADAALREHQRKLARFRDEYRGSLPEEQATTIAKLERLESQRRSIILQINDARAQLASPRRLPPAPGSTELSPREELEERLARLKRVYTAEHPSVRAVERQLASMDAEEIATDPDGYASRFDDRRAQLQAEIDARQARLDEIDAEVLALEALVERTSEITEEYRALEREEVILQEAYTSYLRKLKNADLSRSMELAQQGARLVRLESAIPPTQPRIPRILLTAAALVAALGAGFVFAVLRELLHPVVIDAAHLEKLTGMPNLGAMPRVAYSKR